MIWYFMQIVSLGDLGDSLHEMSTHVFREYKKNISNISSAENFTQNA